MTFMSFTERSIFFRIYAGLLLVCVSVAFFAYLLVDAINQAMVDYQAWVCQTLISSIKSDIAERLESQGTTTFVLQMVRLNQALTIPGQKYQECDHLVFAHFS